VLNLRAAADLKRLGIVDRSDALGRQDIIARLKLVRVKGLICRLRLQGRLENVMGRADAIWNEVLDW
jgi:hypothetical protein